MVTIKVVIPHCKLMFGMTKSALWGARLDLRHMAIKGAFGSGRDDRTSCAFCWFQRFFQRSHTDSTLLIWSFFFISFANSIATVDYDYSKAYGGAGDTSVSSAGGTFGSNTQNISFAANAGATGAALGSMDENSYDGPGGRGGTEQVIHIFAPPGKLGVVIDTPDDGAPVVHAVKDTSVIADRIIVGDKLVAVDDEDVRSMTAIKVSKMISRKGANPSRKLTIVRMVDR
jgi:hypothetical protein